MTEINALPSLSFLGIRAPLANRRELVVLCAYRRWRILTILERKAESWREYPRYGNDDYAGLPDVVPELQLSNKFPLPVNLEQSYSEVDGDMPSQ